MARTQQQYAGGLMLLMPRGDIWDPTVFEELTDAVGPELRRVEQFVELLIEESDPRTVSDLISEWEADWGLPTVCTGPLTLLSDRRNALVSRMIGVPDQSRQTYIDTAAGVGYTITITEYSSGDSVPGMPGLPTADAAFAVQINAPLDTVRLRAYSAPYGEPYASWGDGLLECALNEIAQSHEILIFSYT